MSATVNKTLNSAYSGPYESEGLGYEGLEAISGPVWRVILEVNLGSILAYSEVNSGPYLRNLMEYRELALIWP